MLGEAVRKLYDWASRPLRAPGGGARRQAERALTDEVVAGDPRANRPAGLLSDGSADLPQLGRVLFDVESMLSHPRVDACLGYYKSGVSGAEFELEDASAPDVGEFGL